MLNPKYLNVFTGEMEFLEFTAYPCLDQTPVIRFQREIPERNSLNSIILNLQDRLDDLRISSVFRVYKTKEFFVKQSVNQYIRSTIVWNSTINVWSAIQVYSNPQDFKGYALALVWHQKKKSQNPLCTEETKALFTKQKCFVGRACFSVPLVSKGCFKACNFETCYKILYWWAKYEHVRDCHKD